MNCERRFVFNKSERAIAIAPSSDDGPPLLGLYFAPSRRSGAFLFLVFSPAFLRLFLYFSYTFLLCFKRKEKEKKREEKEKKRKRKDQEKTRKDKKSQRTPECGTHAPTASCPHHTPPPLPALALDPRLPPPAPHTWPPLSARPCDLFGTPPRDSVLDDST